MLIWILDLLSIVVQDVKEGKYWTKDKGLEKFWAILSWQWTLYYVISSDTVGILSEEVCVSKVY